MFWKVVTKLKLLTITINLKNLLVVNKNALTLTTKIKIFLKGSVALLIYSKSKLSNLNFFVYKASFA